MLKFYHLHILKMLFWNQMLMWARFRELDQALFYLKVVRLSVNLGDLWPHQGQHGRE